MKYLLLSIFFLSFVYAEENCDMNSDIKNDTFYLFMGSASIKSTVLASKKIAKIRATAALTEAIVSNIKVQHSIRVLCVGDENCITEEENDVKFFSSTYIAQSDFSVYCEEITNAQQANVIIKVTKEKFKELIFPHIN